MTTTSLLPDVGIDLREGTQHRPHQPLASGKENRHG
jgi:hypothetical protein